LAFRRQLQAKARQSSIAMQKDRFDAHHKASF